MIRALGNTPSPVSTNTPAPKPAPEPTQTTSPAPNGGDEIKNEKQLAFKGIVIKNIPTKKMTVGDFIDFLKSGNSAREIKGGNMRAHLKDNNSYTWDFSGKDNVIKGKTKEAEDILYKDLIANKESIPGVEIHKIDDWA